MLKKIILIVISLVAILIITGCVPVEPTNQEEFEAQIEQGSIAGKAIASDILPTATCVNYPANRCTQNKDGTVTSIYSIKSVILKDSCSGNKSIKYTCPKGFLVRCQETCQNGCEQAGNTAQCTKGEAVVELSSCGNPSGGWRDGVRYVLTANVNSVNVVGSTCFQPTASNIIIDGNGHSLTGTINHNIGIHLEDINVAQIYGFSSITGFDKAIYVRDSNDITFQSMSLLNNNFGIMSEYSNNLQVINVNILPEGNPRGNGFSLFFGRNALLTQNTLRNLAHPISLQGLEGVTVSGNRISTSLRGISLRDVIGGSVSGNTIEQPRISGIVINNGERNTLNNNIVRGGGGNVRDNPLAAIYLEDTTGNTIQGNTVEDTFLNGLELLGSSQNVIRDNVIRRNVGQSGVLLRGSAGNNFNGNTIERNFIGFNTAQVDPTMNVRLDNNIICDNQQTDLTCSGLRAGQGTGNFMSTFSGCPVQSWPLEGTNHRRCSAR